MKPGLGVTAVRAMGPPTDNDPRWGRNSSVGAVVRRKHGWQTERIEQAGIDEVRDRGDGVNAKRQYLDREGAPLRSLTVGPVVGEAGLVVRRDRQQELPATAPPRPGHECADVRPADEPLPPRWHAPGRVLFQERDESVDVALLPGLHVTREQAPPPLVGQLVAAIR